MRHRVSVRRASENAAPAVDSRARPAPIQAKRDGGPDLAAWMSSAARLGHDLRRVEIGRERPRAEGGDRIGRSPRPSASRRERHSPGCSCPGCARSAQIARGPAAAESGDVIQLCKNCKDESCKSGEKCGNKKRSVSDVYKTWNPKQTKSVPIETPWGEVSAQHKRGAPYIRSRAKDYKRSKLKTDYKDFNRGLRGGSEKKDKDDLIAQDLLNETSDYLKTPLQKRGASMLHTTVGLGEQWRKKGGKKIHCSLLRQVKEKKIDLDEVNKRFKYVKSADEGRKQVGRIQDVVEKRSKLEDLSKEEQEIFRNLSPPRDGDFSSDDEEREVKNDFSKKRLFSKKHKESERERLSERRKESKKKNKKRKRESSKKPEKNKKRKLNE